MSFALVALLGCLYTLLAARAVRRFAAAPGPEATVFPAVTLLKPLHGDEPHLYDNLASLCQQDYPGAIQILLGVQDRVDSAIAVVHRLMEQWPQRDIELVVSPISPDRFGANAKVANLIGMQAQIRHEIVLLADSDIGVGRGYLATVVAALSQPSVGLVTCLYRGAAERRFWPRLASMAIDYHFLPSVLIGVSTGIARPCLGATIALRRDTLAAVGGFDGFVDHLADDHALGEAVRSLGLQARVAREIVTHTCAEQSLSELLQHELRWARTIRAVSPGGYIGSFITHPLPFALLAAALMSGGAAGIGIIAVTLVCRLILQLQVDATVCVRMNRWWLGPARDLLSFAVYVAGFFVDAVHWRGRRYEVRPDGTLTPMGNR